MSEQTEPARAPLPRSAKLFALGAVAVALGAFVFLALGGLGDNLVYYWGPKELRAAGPKAMGATIRLGGLVAPGTIKFDPGATALEFSVTDGTDTVPVKSKGAPPQMFRENIGVIVEGTMTKGGYFDSNRLMVSHGNEYRAPKTGEPVDAKKLMESAEATPVAPAQAGSP